LSKKIFPKYQLILLSNIKIKRVIKLLYARIKIYKHCLITNHLIMLEPQYKRNYKMMKKVIKVIKVMMSSLKKSSNKAEIKMKIKMK